jgi:APA family basic amino acid/polyamine antiporter
MSDETLTAEDPALSLPRRFVLAVTVGGVIGLGILRSPGEIAEVVTQPLSYLALWLFAGLFVLLSTAVCAELVGMTPRSGGMYSLVRRAYGPYPGFVIGWVDWLTYATDIALKSVVIVEFTALLFPEAAAWDTPLAITISTAFAAIQLRGIGLGALIQVSTTSLIGLIIVVLSLVLLFVDPPVTGFVSQAPAASSIGRWSLVIAAIIFTYDGWLYASYFSGEIRDGPGAVARSCIKAMIIVLGLYLLLNVALVKSVGLGTLAGSELALARALELAVHPAAGLFVLVAAILILLSHQNLLYMSAPRILQALAVDGLMVRRAGNVSKGGNPVFAVLVTWLVSIGLILRGGFEFLLLLSAFFYVPLYLALIVGIFILRRREPGSERPYRAWGHPYSTIVCLVGWTIITFYQAYAERETALYALVMVAVSWPVYRHLANRK